MFRFFLYINLILVQVFSQTSEDNFSFNTDVLSTESWDPMTTEQPFQFTTGDETNNTWPDIDTTQMGENSTAENTSEQENVTSTIEEMTTEQPFEFTTGDETNNTWPDVTTEIDTTQMWENSTAENTSEQENVTSMIEEMTSIALDMINTTFPSSITPDMLEEMKREIIEAVLRNISIEINSRFEEMEARLSALKCSNNSNTTAIELSWQIYENLQIPLTGWLRVFDEPYSHQTRIDDLNEIAGICQNEVLVGATYDGSISLAAVGPASVLTLNTLWNQPQQFGQVYWYRSSGKSFGFSPTAAIRQTSADNQDLDSPLRLSWLLDQKMGGYRAGVTRSLADNALWHKVIYCN